MAPLVTPIVYRRARHEDVAAIVRLLADDPLGSQRESEIDPLSARYIAAYEAIAADPRQELLVAEAAGKVVGCLQLTLIPGLSWQGMTRAQIEDVRVIADRRRSGIGRNLLRHAIERARAQGCRMIQLLVHEDRADARRFYEGLGFSAYHRGLRLLLA